MDQKTTVTLLELAAKSLLNYEPAAIHALDEIPRDLFVPLFNAAFSGGYKTIVKAMVRVWPFHCLHIGSLNTRESYYDILEAMIDGLQILPAQNSSSWGPKLRILDLRSDLICKTICSEIGTAFPFCFQSCIYSQHSILKIEAQRRVRCLGIGNSGSEPQSAQEPMELLVDISLDSTLRTEQFLSFLCSKIQQNVGSLHVCCRDLQIDRMSGHKSILQFLDLGCIENLEMDQVNLSEVITLLARVIHLSSLTLCYIPFKFYKRRNFRSFLLCLGWLDDLQELSLSFFCPTDQLHKLLRVVPPQLDTPYLPFCSLSNRDVTVLSQSSQATHLRALSLSNNQTFPEVYEPFQTLLEKVSSTLQHLEINNCMITDSTLSVILPALRHCTHLRVLSFAFNPITMPVLRSLLQHLTSLMKLKYVIYPVPVHCYEEWIFHDRLDRQKLAEVQAQLEAMLHGAQRNDMKWATVQSDFHSTGRCFNTDVWP
ncbi:PREDICTED: leucine-rich repeat-containing protein PRAME-like [Lipotes vexillifer]|uniref:Leucine-rich repeat-containing protein PRAME-like n=1 Tax=Lipotes vexillifer TaxID=118797 RepID=A0A340WR60_LIPVE|nr:PREDICTED: leucine-rich repeat-containing protein PRAME-like [Lipotes vexillifer]